MKEMQNKIKEYFKELQFDAQAHSYEVRGKSLTSVSKFIHKYVENVDFDKIAGFIARKRGVTKEEVLGEWEAKKNFSCVQGTSVHLFGETYHTLRQKPTNGFEEAIVKFWDTIPQHIEPCLFEIKMFSKSLGIAGTSDLLFYNTLTKKFIILDFKTNEDLFKNYKGKTLLTPFNNLLDSPYSKYEIQLSAYQILFEQCGYEVESRKIIWLKPDSTYTVYNTQDLTKLVFQEMTKIKSK